jgi:cytochrome P450
VWVLCKLSLRPDLVDAVQNEIHDVTGSVFGKPLPSGITYEMTKNMTFLDSLIREVLRTKGDTLSLARKTTADVPLGEYIIPKGALRMTTPGLTLIADVLSKVTWLFRLLLAAT